MSLISTWSFSRLKEFEKCPYRIWLTVGEKRSTEHVDRTAADRGTEVHLEAELFIKDKGPFTKNLKRFADYFNNLKTRYENGEVELEGEWAYTDEWVTTGWWDDNVWCRMKLDNFIVEHNEDGPLVATATDYKTGKKHGNEVTHNEQGQLYAVGAFMRHPTLELVNIDFMYLDHGQHSRPKQYTREFAMKFWPMWDARARKLTEATDFPPRANKQTCMWCPFGPQNGDGSCEWGV